MAQVTFNSDPTPALSDLDANFTELYDKSAWSTTGIGYKTGAGGAVTQLTSKSTGVTLNKMCGQITTHNASLSAGASATFTLSNSNIAATDVVVASIGSAASSNDYRCSVVYTGAGSCSIELTNRTGGALGAAVPINFVVIKAVNS